MEEDGDDEEKIINKSSDEAGISIQQTKILFYCGAYLYLSGYFQGKVCK